MRLVVDLLAVFLAAGPGEPDTPTDLGANVWYIGDTASKVDGIVCPGVPLASGFNLDRLHRFSSSGRGHCLGLFLRFSRARGFAHIQHHRHHGSGSF